MGVEGRTPRYLVREELQRDKLWGRAGRRAMAFEQKLNEGKGSELARRCWEEMKERYRKGKTKSRWEEERKDFFGSRKMRLEEIERRREEEETWIEEIENREKDRQRRERWEKIKESKYNRWYKEVKGERIPGYLKKDWGESRWRRVARFRLGSEVRVSIG